MICFLRAALAVLMTAGCLALHPSIAQADVSGVVRGTVTSGGTPRSGIIIVASGEGVTLRATSDARGAFAFARVPFGRYALAAHDAERGATATVDVSSDAVVDIALALETTRTIGTARARRGIGGNPVSVTTLSSAELTAAPQTQRLNRLLETVPGIVRFSYDEPVAHGFHGIAYDIDGAPIPQTTSASFSDALDARNIDSLEIFTGAFPAEFGGSRQGALVNVVTKRNVDIPNGSQTLFSPGFGSYGGTYGFFSNATRFGSTDVFLNSNVEETSRALDTPSLSIVHDAGSLTDQFVRTITRLGSNDTLAINLSNQYNTYQVPINLAATPVDSIVNVPGQDDVQREYSSFATVNYTHVGADGSNSFQVIPWFRASRIVYAGDLANDVLALGGLAQDRRATVFGLRANDAHTSPVHALKFGVEGAVENFRSAETIAIAGADPFSDNVNQRGTTLAGYAQDTWTPSRALAVNLGLRYDLSQGFVEGNLVQPRVGVNVRIAPETVAHVYYGRLYAAPALEDTRRDAVVIGGGDLSALPLYDLKPQTESYAEAGLGHTFSSGMYASINAWQRNVWNVLDTTQIYPTPIFATYNNARGLAHGFEVRLEQRTLHDDWYLSAAYSQSVAAGISGGTFLFTPDQVSDTSFQPEDHDQAVAINDAYTRRFGAGSRWYASVGSEYGTGYPVQFQDGNGRLTPHLTFDASLGRTPAPGAIGVRISALDLTGYQYLIKVNNGFNTTQYAAGLQVRVEGQLAF